MDWQRDLPSWPLSDWSRQVRCRPHIWHVQERGEGPSVLFLHGAGAATHSWSAIMANLAKDHHVIAIDLPGHGFTIAGSPSRSGLEPMAEDIARLCQQEGWQPNKIIAHSAGAAIALELCDQHLQQIKTGILACNPAFDEFEGLASVVFPFLAKTLALNPFTPWLFTSGPDPLSRAQRLIASTGSSLSEEKLRYYAKLLSDPAHVRGALNMMAQWSLKGFRQRLRQSRTRCEIVIGLNDRAVDPDRTLRSQELLVNSSIVELAGLGHLAHEEAPDMLISIIRNSDV